MTTINPVSPPTLGQHVDAITIALHERVALLEAAVGKDTTTAWTWAKGNWLHLTHVTGTAVLLLKVFGKL